MDWREGEGAWKKRSGYHVRSLVKTTFSRRQALFGGRLMSRPLVRQLQEVAVEVWLMNEHASRSLA